MKRDEKRIAEMIAPRWLRKIKGWVTEESDIIESMSTICTPREHTIEISRENGPINNGASILISVIFTEQGKRDVTWIKNEKGEVVAALVRPENYQCYCKDCWERGFSKLRLSICMLLA